MTRAMNIKLPEPDVRAICASQSIRISAIETLPSGGTHLVCTTIEDADEARRKFKKNLIEGRVKRFAFYWVPQK
jgi:hypothetical protein